MILAIITLLMMFVIGFEVASIIRQHKIGQILEETNKENEELLKKSKENLTETKDIMEAKEYVGKLKGKMEIIEKFNYFLW